MEALNAITAHGVALFAFAWPLVVAWLAFKFFPASLTKFVEKEIDRRSDAKLERLKAELQGSYSTLKTSVDVLATSNSDMRPHIIEAVTALWATMTDMRNKFGGVITFDTVVLADEAEAAFSGKDNQQTLGFVKAFDGDMLENKLVFEFEKQDLDKCRLFCGDRLWLIFYIYRAVIMRSAFLISLSFKNQKYDDWRKDGGIRQLLSGLIGVDETEKLRQSTSGGLTNALGRLETDFLHEAARIMSGSKAMADSLADMQAMMMLQNAKIAEQAKQA